jgi:1-acyl-sn-glycerol-3-phosphate acyltransferase
MAQYEKLLTRYRALRWLGVFGLDREGLALPGLRYALQLLRDPRHIVWIFPQGVLVPQWHPIAIKPGALWLARRSGAAVLPVVFRYEWLVESRPSIFVSVGAPLKAQATDEELRNAMQGLYDSIADSLAPLELSSYRSLFEPRMSMNKRWELLTWAGKRGRFNPRNE